MNLIKKLELAIEDEKHAIRVAKSKLENEMKIIEAAKTRITNLTTQISQVQTNTCKKYINEVERYLNLNERHYFQRWDRIFCIYHYVLNNKLYVVKIGFIIEDGKEPKFFCNDITQRSLDNPAHFNATTKDCIRTALFPTDRNAKAVPRKKFNKSMIAIVIDLHSKLDRDGIFYKQTEKNKIIYAWIARELKESLLSSFKK